jgi:hypothetical protein
MQRQLLTTDHLNVEREQCDRFEDQMKILEFLRPIPIPMEVFKSFA